MDLKNKNILITGAAQGLGKEIAGKCAELGAVLFLLDREKNLLLKVAENLSGKTTVEAFDCDVKNHGDVKDTIQKIKADKIDILINNAGIWTDNEIEKTNKERRKEAFETNTNGMINVTEELLPSFIKRNQGMIVNVISVAGTANFDDLTEWRSYGASKWGARGYTKSLRDSLKGTRIKITAFYPGGFESNLYENAGWDKEKAHNQPWMMRTEDVANAIIYAITTPEDIEVSEIIIRKKM